MGKATAIDKIPADTKLGVTACHSSNLKEMLK